MRILATLIVLVAGSAFAELPDGHWGTYRDVINAATPEQVQQMARRCVRPDESVIVVVGRADELRAVLEPYGPVTVLDRTGNLQ